MTAFDMIVVGNSFGGIAAAIAARDAGMHVALVTGFSPIERGVIGGQVTAQGVSALDEHPHIETFGGTRRYYAFRNGIRSLYRAPHIAEKDWKNPGGGWVSRLCFKPADAAQVLTNMSWGITWIETPVINVHMSGRTIQSIDVYADEEKNTLFAPLFLDATNLGDLLPLTGTQYTTGVDNDPARRDETQAFTYGFAVEYCSGESHIIPKPEGYEDFKTRQPYTFTLKTHDGGTKTYPMFAGDLPFWEYRRIYNGKAFGGNDIALINWASNDYYFRNIIDKPAIQVAAALNEAKRLSLGFLYWLQTEAPRDEGGYGYPELKLRPDIMLSEDGLSQAPYIRESRRIVAIDQITSAHIVHFNNLQRETTHGRSSVGVGWYAIDVHSCVGNPDVSIYEPTIPFQIPLEALIPSTTENLIAACKNIGTTHLSNGAYRVHPVEWNIGESAGMLAAFCTYNRVRPSDVCERWKLLDGFQHMLLQQGIPLAWTLDMPVDHPDFVETQKRTLASFK
jgi:hypothetical protein